METEEPIIDVALEDPTTSVRQVGGLLDVPFKTVNRVIRDEELHPHHYTKVKVLFPTDYASRMEFGR